MLYNYNHVAHKFYFLLFVTACFVLFTLLSPTDSHADENALSITIAPPLFQLSLQPGETWTSGISIVNNNDYDVTLYAEPYLFKPLEESGRPHFFSPESLTEEDDTDSTLISWLTVPQVGFTIKSGQTYTLPLAIEVPSDASPGGHYAALLIGNKIPDEMREGGTVSVSSSVASLMFLSISGDVVEKGRVRDFFTEKSLYQTAEANFTLRFENQGNVHLVPRGYIKIFSMFGKERGYIPINDSNDYGNVLPESIRKFNYVWTSDSGLWDIGRYKAEATINYGSNEKQSALSTTYFYVLPVVSLLQILFGIIAIAIFISWSLKMYVRRALAIESQKFERKSDTPQSQETQKVSVGTLVKPIQVGLVDLRRTTIARPQPQIAQEITPEIVQKRISYKTFIYNYRYFFLFLTIGVIVWFGISLFVEDVTTIEREYNVSEVRPDGSIIELPTEHIK